MIRFNPWNHPETTLKPPPETTTSPWEIQDIDYFFWLPLNSTWSWGEQGGPGGQKQRSFLKITWHLKTPPSQKLINRIISETIPLSAFWNPLPQTHHHHHPSLSWPRLSWRCLSCVTVGSHGYRSIESRFFPSKTPPFFVFFFIDLETFSRHFSYTFLFFCSCQGLGGVQDKETRGERTPAEYWKRRGIRDKGG